MAEEKKFDEQVLHIRRVSKKTPGGNYITFSALVAVGDKNHKVGIGIAKAVEVPAAIEKAVSRAKKNMVTVPLRGTTLISDILVKYKSAKIYFKPAPTGTGLKAGSVVRKILELGGVKDVSVKIIGSRNKLSNAYAVIKAFRNLNKLNKNVVSE
ncbi:MAG: hypothetical protein KatS3mg090_0294 [Patescibacteria group bacterium]|nr:MAG: hypothetical protein KatS3mg090_0294 [Patescibacteria group bacterium]